jgi:thiamine kinase-like enzyme
VYRIALVSGATIKARRLEDEATARALCDLRRELPPAFVPVLARHGRVLLEPWIDGEELHGRSPSEEELAAAGALLAALHTLTTAAGQPVRATATTALWRERSDRALADTVRRGALDARVQERLGAALARLDPGTTIVGLVHTDFCGENMVVDASGALHVVDNERVSVDALGYDLGRTWARWGLTDPEWALFAAAYAARGAPPEALAALAFWRLVATATAAAVRLRLDAATPETFARLRQLAAQLA